MERHGYPSDGFCSPAHRAEYSLRTRHVPEPAKGLAGFKPPILSIGIEIGQRAVFRQSERELRMPGPWYLSLTPKRGIRVRASFQALGPVTPRMAPLRPISAGADAILTRIENWVNQHSGAPGWDIRPRLTPPRNASSLPPLLAPLSRPVNAWEHPATAKLQSTGGISSFPAATLEILPELPALDLKPERIIEPEYALPLSNPGTSTSSVTNWVHRPELALPADRSSRIRGLETRDQHLPLSPQPAAGPESSPIVTESQPVPSHSSNSRRHFTGPLPDILNPGPTRPASAITPSSIGPKAIGPSVIGANLLNSHPDTPSRVFTTVQKSCNAPIPEAQTDAALRGPRMWFAVRVPSPYVLETPTPVDMSKRLHYVHAARHMCSTAIPAEVVWYPAGLRAGEKQILHAVPDPLSDSAVFQKFARALGAKSVPEILQPLPPIASVIRRTLPPVDQHPQIAEAFLPHNLERFPMGLAILWTTTLNEPALKASGAATREIHPVPDSPEPFPFQNRSLAEPAWVFQLASPIGASFATSLARTCEPEAGRVAIPEVAPAPWRKTAARPSGSERLPQPVRLAPALAPFRKIARPESMESSFAEDLRDRIFEPILPPVPRTHLRAPGFDIIGSRLRESRTFAPLDFRWQRNRKARDRGAPWKPSVGAGSLPSCDIPRWPGPLSDAWWGDPEGRPN